MAVNILKIDHNRLALHGAVRMERVRCLYYYSLMDVKGTVKCQSVTKLNVFLYKRCEAINGQTYRL